MMKKLKKQKLIGMLFCCALLICAFTTTAGAQELAGTTYRLSILTTVGINLNADATFQTNTVFLLSIGAGSGSYYTYVLDPNTYFFSTYSAYNVEVGGITASSLSLYFAGGIVSSGESILGVGFATIKGTAVPDGPVYFFFSGQRIS